MAEALVGAAEASAEEAIPAAEEASAVLVAAILAVAELVVVGSARVQNPLCNRARL